MTWFMLSTLLGTVLAPFTGLINKFLHSVSPLTVCVSYSNGLRKEGRGCFCFFFPPGLNRKFTLVYKLCSNTGVSGQEFAKHWGEEKAAGTEHSREGALGGRCPAASRPAPWTVPEIFVLLFPPPLLPPPRSGKDVVLRL